LDSFGRIGAFQWVTAEKNKKFLLRLHSRRGLWAIAETPHARRLARVPPIVVGELLIDGHYSNDFCLIQEKSTSSRMTLVPANPSASPGRAANGDCTWVEPAPSLRAPGFGTRGEAIQGNAGRSTTPGSPRRFAPRDDDSVRMQRALGVSKREGPFWPSSLKVSG
jgi:hypothetical protein